MGASSVAKSSTHPTLGIVSAYYGLNIAGLYASGHVGTSGGAGSGYFLTMGRARRANVSALAFIEVGNAFARQLCMQCGLDVKQGFDRDDLLHWAKQESIGSHFHACITIHSHKYGVREVAGKRSSWHGAKIAAFIMAPFELSVFLDADTVVCPSNMEAILRHGFELMGSHQVGGVFEQMPWSIDELNSGVIFWRRSGLTKAMWDMWQANHSDVVESILSQPCTGGYQTECDPARTSTGRQEVIVPDQIAFSVVLRAFYYSHGLRVHTFHSMWNARPGNPLVCPWDPTCKGPCLSCSRMCCSTPLADGTLALIDHGCSFEGNT